MKPEVKDGRFTGFISIPIQEVNVMAVLKYADVSDYTPAQIAEYMDVTIDCVHTAISRLKKGENHARRYCKTDNMGRRKGTISRKVELCETDTVTQSRLKKLMIANGDSCSDIARYCGVTNTAATRWVFDGSIPRTEHIKLIADHYYVNPLYLTGQVKSPFRR